MSGAFEKAISIVEYLAARPEGAALAAISADLNQLRSACHRTLQELIGHGYVRPLPQRGSYALTSKLASLGLSYLSKSGVVDIAQPLIDRLAGKTEELVRLAIVDGERLTLVAKAQGSRSGLRYDPDMGIELNLSCSAAGHAWLMTLTEEQAVQAVARQGMGDRARFGPNAPRSLRALLSQLKDHRRRGFSMLIQTYAPGMCSMAAPVQRRGEHATGVIVVAGPAVRLTPTRMLQHGQDLLDAAAELAVSGNASPLMQAAHVGTWGNRTDGTAPGITRRIVRR